MSNKRPRDMTQKELESLPLAPLGVVYPEFETIGKIDGNDECNILVLDSHFGWCRIPEKQIHCENNSLFKLQRSLQ
ncbi:MAG: hypothetical protein ACFE95_12375 [Candidatus Hodarchaeota archaeon]